MYRLGALTEQQKSRYGWTALVVGFVAIALGVFIIHWAHFPQTRMVNGVEQPVVIDYFNWMPRDGSPSRSVTSSYSWAPSSCSAERCSPSCWVGP